MKRIRYFLMLVGMVMIIYGELLDTDTMTFHPAIIVGISLFVIGLMLNNIIEMITGKKYNNKK